MYSQQMVVRVCECASAEKQGTTVENTQKSIRNAIQFKAEHVSSRLHTQKKRIPCSLKGKFRFLIETVCPLY